MNDVYGRLRLRLESLAVLQPDATRLIAEQLTHKEFANRIGCSREMVSRLMKDLERGGIIVPAGAGSPVQAAARTLVAGRPQAFAGGP